MMDLVHLKSFAEVAERGTIAAAAAAQGYTAPAVSQHIAKLEANLGTQLFDRVGGRVALTAAGAALLPIAFEMLDLDARGRATVNEPGDLPHVVFAGFASAISTVLIPRLGRLREHATIEISEAEDTEALRDLGLGAVDVVLTQEYDRGPPSATADSRLRPSSATASPSSFHRTWQPPRRSSSSGMRPGCSTGGRPDAHWRRHEFLAPLASHRESSAPLPTTRRCSRL